jgi:arsenate reductase-like glutaredoxin family protein
MDYYSDDDNIIPYVPNGSEVTYPIILYQDYLHQVEENMYLLRAYCMEGNRRRYCGFSSIDDFVRIMKKSGNSEWHEVIRNNGTKYQKFFIDIDCKVDELVKTRFDFNDYVDSVIFELTMLFYDAGIFPDVQLINLDSDRDDKYSRHIICKNVNVQGHHMKCLGRELSNRVFTLNGKDKNTINWIDLSVYDKNHSLRTHLSVKKGAPAFRDPTTENKEFDVKTLITICEDESIDLDCPSFMCIDVKKEERKTKTANITTQVKESVNDLKPILDGLSPKRYNNYDSWCKIGMVLYNVYNGGIEGLLLWDECSRKYNPAKYNDGECAKKYDTFKAGSDMLTIATLIAWSKEDCPDKLVEYRQNQIKIEKPTKITALEYYKLQVKNAKNIERLVLNEPKPNKVTKDSYIKINLMEQVLWAIKSAMNTGKSALIINHIKEQLANDPYFKCILLQFRTSLSDNVVERTKELGFTDYRDVSGSLKLDWVNRLIVQVESLHRLIYDDIDLLVIDEVESVNAQIFAGLNVKNNDLIQIIFKDIVKKAKRVVIMDGLLRDKTVQAYEILTKKKFYVHINEPIVEKKKLQIMVSECQWKDSIIGDLCIDRKIYVVSPKGRNFIEKLAKYIETMCANKCKTIRILTIYGGKDNTQVTGNFSAELVKYDLVIASPSVSAGVDFNVDGYFYKVYSYVTSGKVGADSQLQSLKRVRKPICKDITMFVQNCAQEMIPLNPESIIQAAESKIWHNSIEGIKWPVGVKYNRKGSGDIVFKNKEKSWFKFFLLVQSSINVQKFDVFRCMVNFLEKDGYEIEFVDVVKSPESVKTSREIGKLTLSKNNRDIAKADEISIVAARDLLSNKFNTPEDEAKLSKYNIRAYYGWKGDIDELFVKTYRKEKISRMFRTMKDKNVSLEKLAADAEGRILKLGDVQKTSTREKVDKHQAIRELIDFVKKLENESREIIHNGKPGGNLDKIREYINKAVESKHSAYKGRKTQINTDKICMIVNSFINDYGYSIKLVSRHVSTGEDKKYKLISIFEKYFTLDVNNKSLPYIQTNV